MKTHTQISEKNLIHKHENILYKTSLFFAIVFWLFSIIGTLGIGLIYTLFGLMIMIAIQAGFISYIKGNGVLVSTEQFPELDTIKKEVAASMGCTSYTHMYIINMDGMLNAFATRFLSRNFIIITANLLESCDDNEKLTFIIAHELAHLKRGHVFMQGILLPSKLIPWLGNAYSKACEYTCDNYGVFYGTGNVTKSVKGLAILSVGGKYSEKININAYLEQAKDSGDFWMSLHETKSTHPYLSKRVHHLMTTFGDHDEILPKRNIFGIVLAPFFSFWFWIIAIYGGVILSLIISEMSSGNYKSLLSSPTEKEYEYAADVYTENETTEDISSTEQELLSLEQLDQFFTYYQQYYGVYGWSFELYDKNIASEEYGQEGLSITKLTEDGFYATYYDDESEMFINKKFLTERLQSTSFYINTPYGYYNSTMDLNSLQTAIDNNQ